MKRFISPTSGQAMLLTVMMLGVIMALVVVFGAKRQEDVANLVQRLDASQVGTEALAAAGKRIQGMYANESSCDPDVLNTRINSLPSLPVAAGSLNFSGVDSYAVAAPERIDHPEQRENRCVSVQLGSTGCRQLAVPVENRAYVINVGAVVANPDRDGDDNRTTEPSASYQDRDCPRDAIVRLSTTINGSVYFQRFSLINICTMQSCTTCSPGNPSCKHPSDNFEFVGRADTATWKYTTACGRLMARWFGSMVSEALPSGYTDRVGPDDLRWARRYLETGGGGIGDTTHLDFTPPAPASANLACDVGVASLNQCVGRPCVPAFDLNRDGTNNEIDLAILEAYLRGFIPILPANALDPRL